MSKSKVYSFAVRRGGAGAWGNRDEWYTFVRCNGRPVWSGLGPAKSQEEASARAAAWVAAKEAP